MSITNIAPADDTTGSRTDGITGRWLVRIQWVGFVSSDHIPEPAVSIGSFLHALTRSCRAEWQNKLDSLTAQSMSKSSSGWGQ